MEIVNQHIGDINSKTIFKNNILCAQFIRDNLNIPLLRDVQPEDLEDVTEHFNSYFGIEYEADTVKRIRIRIEDYEESFYMISLIDHKSDVDYNVAMQLLKYMACIWAEYEKTFLAEHGRISKNKSFKYPPIIPVVYYEGKREWTADMHLRDRIMFSDILRPYIPDFKYIVVRNHDFSDEELLDRKDEMSLLMLINKFQTADDITNFRDIEKDKIDSIIHNSPEQVIDIIAAVVRSLCTKIHISAEETDDAVQKVREHKLGYLFENMEKIDIQQLRQEAEDWRKVTEKERQKVEEERQKADKERQKAEEERQKAEEERQKAEEERQKAEEERTKFKSAAFMILKMFFGDTDLDITKIKSAIDSEMDTDKIANWMNATESDIDKMELYNKILEK